MGGGRGRGSGVEGGGEEGGGSGVEGGEVEWGDGMGEKERKEEEKGVREGGGGRGGGGSGEGRKICIVLYNTIQYKYEYYYSGINPIEFRGHSKRLIVLYCMGR